MIVARGLRGPHGSHSTGEQLKAGSGQVGRWGDLAGDAFDSQAVGPRRGACAGREKSWVWDSALPDPLSVGCQSS